MAWLGKWTAFRTKLLSLATAEEEMKGQKSLRDKNSVDQATARFPRSLLPVIHLPRHLDARVNQRAAPGH